MFSVATWNVNSIKVRLPLVLAWLEKHKIDVLFLQEIKCTNDNFPADAFSQIGYHSLVAGQPGYNGVAILSREKLELVSTALIENDPQQRFLEARLGDWHLINIYAPNGNPIGTEKFDYKLIWTDKLEQHLKKLLANRQKFLIAGDFNIIPEADDARHPHKWRNDALFQKESRQKWRALCHPGLQDAYRALKPDDKDAFTFWDYQAGAWQNDDGIRIDHFLLSPKAADQLESCAIDREPRDQERPSDHTPVIAVFKE